MACFLLPLLFFLPNFAAPQFRSGGFSYNGYYLNTGGAAELDPSGLFALTTSTRQETGHIFYANPIQFKNFTNGSVFSFSTTFIFAIVSENPKLSGGGLAFVISPDKNLTAASAEQYLGIFNEANNGKSSNHVAAVELDTVKSNQFADIDNNHVGIDLNDLRSEISASAGYFTSEGRFKNLSLTSGDPMQIWVEYDGVESTLNVTLHPINVPKPKTPLLSLKRDLSSYLYEHMYVGFSSSTGNVISHHYILAWNFGINDRAEDIDLSRLPKFSRSVHVNDKRIQKILAVSLSLTGLALILVLLFAAVWISRKKKKFIEILEEWEVLYGPHRFSYKDLFKATKGFKQKELLGKGGFGRVYKGNLPSSNAQIAVKRISHDSRQGMREFVAEIATIGRLRHPNLVRLLGYCRRRTELLLVYDYMPNGSLDKFLYHLPDDQSFTWTQRFKIIKDVASALFYLHQQWIQVIIHRDIKPANVLIDGDMNARLGDFGLAKLCDIGNDPQTSHVAGTLGYMAPELARTGKASTSTDIYAFGVFMLEVACGRRPIDVQASPDEVILVDWIIDCWDGGDILETIDKRLGNRYVVQEAELILKLGLLCSHQVAAARPSMSSVQQLLDGVVRLPDNLSSLIKAKDFPEGSNDFGTPNGLSEGNSISSLTITESLKSYGR